MTDKEHKPIKVEFAPGCFDSFEGTQEELDEMMVEIQHMFATMTPEELASRTSPLDIDALIEEDPEHAEHLLRVLAQDEAGEDLADEFKRKLQ